MDAEKVLFKTTVKFGGKVYDKGTILSAPLPHEIITELRIGSGLVEILEKTKPIEKPKVDIQPEVALTQESEQTQIPIYVEKTVPIPKPKRGRRKKLNDT